MSTDHNSNDAAATQPAPPPGIQPVQPATTDTAQVFARDPIFPRQPAETPRAFSAFMAFFALGHSRCLQAVADQLGEKPATVKKWSSKFRWSERIQSFNSGLLQQQAQAEAAARSRQAADWARRTSQYREAEWETAQKLLGAVQCFLENFGDREIEKMTLTQVARALGRPRAFSLLTHHSPLFTY